MHFGGNAVELKYEKHIGQASVANIC